MTLNQHRHMRWGSNPIRSQTLGCGHQSTLYPRRYAKDTLPGKLFLINHVTGTITEDGISVWKIMWNIVASVVNIIDMLSTIKFMDIILKRNLHKTRKWSPSQYGNAVNVSDIEYFVQKWWVYSILPRISCLKCVIDVI